MESILSMGLRTCPALGELGCGGDMGHGESHLPGGATKGWGWRPGHVPGLLGASWSNQSSEVDSGCSERVLQCH